MHMAKDRTEDSSSASSWRLRQLSLQVTASLVGAAGTMRGGQKSDSAARVQACGAVGPPQKRLALVTTEIRRRSHGQHMGDRFLHGYPKAGRWHRPAFRTVSIYVDQQNPGSLAAQRAEAFDAEIYDTIADALCCGKETLAVDAVLIIGEHGEYMDNEFGQKMYPRYEFFMAVVDVFRRCGRVVPVFSDKHLSYDWSKAVEMVEVARELGIPFAAGSSLPCAWRMPAVDMPWGAAITEVMSVSSGGVDSGDIHALESIQCMVERRAGGETGVASIQVLQGDAFWAAHAAGSWEAGGWDLELFESCLSRSQQLVQWEPLGDHGQEKGSAAGAGAVGGASLYNQIYPTYAEIRSSCEEPTAYKITYCDGTRSSMLLMNGLVNDNNFAARLPDYDAILSTNFHLDHIAEMPYRNTQYSSLLMSNAEEMFESGVAHRPIERTLLTTGMVAVACRALHEGGDVLKPTPHLAEIKYSVGQEQLWGGRDEPIF